MACSVKYCFFCNEKLKERIVIKRVQLLINVVKEKKQQQKNEQNADIQFTKEIEENGELPFLDCLTRRDNNELRTTVYRKLTHTDRLLDESSYNPTSHKATTIKTLTRRAQLVFDTPDGLRDENRYLERVFHKHNYNADFIRRNIYRPTEADTTNRNPTPVTTVIIPYIKAGTSETISRILQP